MGQAVTKAPMQRRLSDNGLADTGPTANDFRDVQRMIATTHSYCEFVNFEGLFSPTIDNLSDGIHPTDAGNLLYANGIKNKSTLLGNTPASAPLAFYRNSSRVMVKSIPGIFTISAAGGTAPYAFTLVSGSLPAGLNFNGDGAITGTPQTSGTFTLNIKVTDAASASVTQQFTLVVNPQPNVTVSPAVAPYVVAGQYKSIQFAGANGYGPYTLSLAPGSVLPAGMSFNAATGLLSGTPTTTGTSAFSISATDHYGFSGSTNYTLSVLSAVPQEHFTATAQITPTGHLLLTGHLLYPHSQTLYTYIGASYTVNGNQFYLSGNNVNVEAGNVNGTTVDMGLMNYQEPGTASVTLANAGIFPSTLDGSNINYSADTTLSVNAPTPSANDSLTVTATINSSGHLMVSCHLARPYSIDIYSYISATYTQGGSTYYFDSGYGGGEFKVSAGTTDTGPVDFGPMPYLNPGAFTVQLQNWGVSPPVADYTNTVYKTYTDVNLTK